jgi:hypothetical protein
MTSPFSEFDEDAAFVFFDKVLELLLLAEFFDCWAEFLEVIQGVDSLADDSRN